MSRAAHKMPDGTLVYVQKGKPPDVPPGYRRESLDLKNPGAWVLIPVLPECGTRDSKTEVGPCGAIKTIYHCKGRRIRDLSECHRCDRREP